MNVAAGTLLGVFGCPIAALPKNCSGAAGGLQCSGIKTPKGYRLEICEQFVQVQVGHLGIGRGGAAGYGLKRFPIIIVRQIQPHVAHASEEIFAGC